MVADEHSLLAGMLGDELAMGSGTLSRALDVGQVTAGVEHQRLVMPQTGLEHVDG